MIVTVTLGYSSLLIRIINSSSARGSHKITSEMSTRS
jgi:hypothetical protein